jgi:hypothetical protein
MHSHAVCVAPKLGLGEAIMGSLYAPLLVTVLAASLASTASAQDGSTGQPAPNAATLPSNLPSNAPDTLTGKERLGRKWMDEQRIDNCKVPIDKRGTRPRSSTCSHVPVG